MDHDSTPGLSVDIVRLQPIPADRVPASHRCGFAYTIRINNHGEKTVRLLGRKWMIKQADGEIETVEGEGVVGEQPIIPAGESHAYTSFCLLTGDHGAMWGFYFGEDDEETPVMWRIPRFDMALSADEADDEPV
jgi:ApaG protein